ncbi:MAG: chemotaxis protein CheV [gamma proteobacterium symbiont of Taylorina sp.]|nr:chemotaxis protein CheV [gamma proteobacterium symbiont of Taylorina sp.]
MADLPNIDDIISIIDDDMEDDELDLVKLVSTNANDTNQYLLFLGSDNQYYAKNISKIEELLVYRDLDIVHNHDKDNYISGTANIRGKMTSIVNFDKWMGNPILDDDQYELVIIVCYGGKRFAIVVKEVEDIVTIDSKDMSDNSADNSKSSFISKINININGIDKLCTIFDSDRFLLDVFDTIEKQSNAETSNFIVSKRFASKKKNKTILFADDSRFIRKMVEKLFLKLECQYKIYNDGQALIDDLVNIEPSDIGLFITDLEMPGASGREVIRFIRQDNSYDNINIIIHTNMSNNVKEKELSTSQIAKTIGKVDMLALGEAIEEFILY